MSHIARQTVDREKLATALEHANIPTLLLVLTQLTGEREWLRAPYLPTRVRGLVDDDSAGIDAALLPEIRAAALEAVVAWHAGRPAELPAPEGRRLLEMMSASIAYDAPAEYGLIFAEDVRLDNAPAVGTASAYEIAPVIIVGAGLSGMLVAHELERRGIPFEIVERNADVGGVWFSNTYPGAGVDTPSQLYSLDEVPNAWSTTFSRQPEMLEYARRVEESFDLRAHIRFETTVTSASFEPDIGEWTVNLRGPDGSIEIRRAPVLISAVGTFNNASYPSVSGIDSFDGTILHTADWVPGTDLGGKRIAVIGAGASAMQLVPKIADQVDDLTLFQRTPQWIAPVEDYFAAIPDEVNFLVEAVPLYREWWRFRLATIWNDGAYPALVVDPEWEGLPLSVNRINAGQRRYYERYLREQLAGRDDLIELSIPSYPPFGKRLLLDNGWFRAIRRDNVRVIPRGISALDATGVIDSSGEHHEVDLIIFATGYTAADYLSSLPIRVGEWQLAEQWAGNQAAAYLGMTVPGFPNLFIMYGPNIHPGPGGSYLFLAECSARYIADAVEFATQNGPVEVRDEVFRAYQDDVDAANAALVWGTSQVHSYAKNAAGRVVTNFPWRVGEYWMRTREFRPEDYLVRRPAVTNR